MTILIGYSSCDGQARKIAQHIAKEQTEAVELRDLSQTDQWPDPKDFSKVLIGASIRYGKFRPVVHQYVEHFVDALGSRPNAFFGVCLTARKPGKDDPQVNVYMRKFMQRHQWQPQCKAMFAGALRYSRYNWWQTRLIQFIMKITGGSTDTSQDIEFTDWDKVADFAQKFREL
ncbi:menaquinone-dependent protoporphyrinogen IX dehydrogenase [Celerinatantimonas diazotrophica]|uniref:Protoporphyrinogen IX dehydrogenase [quinone] n=1 Tax=Celerinatantimonas diazotrophica TaxID=412034 RepID=A0A4R1J9P4_9GAMM|nr:menaquinone-dependent protoporphyrinogen IX dehydrogenase [Celerinatantimonas diazotrophica]TCK47308.1 protoporphyrinogen oxidase [Celerinatantimonas diazotrophica]CAG9295076.1 Protoporphyrinogen IX dehydrogenase [menaquinone] [Celerinatantimonas diazotrophica]